MDGPCPVIVAGDLNAAPDSAVLRPLRDMLTDAWIAGHGDPAAVTLPSSHPSAPLEAGPELVDQRIDHIFFRPGQQGMQILVESHRSPAPRWTASTRLIIKRWFVIFVGLRREVVSPWRRSCVHDRRSGFAGYSASKILAPCAIPPMVSDSNLTRCAGAADQNGTSWADFPYNESTSHADAEERS